MVQCLDLELVIDVRCYLHAYEQKGKCVALVLLMVEEERSEWGSRGFGNYNTAREFQYVCKKKTNECTGWSGSIVYLKLTISVALKPEITFISYVNL